MKKVCAKWVPHCLAGAHKMERVRCATQMLAVFEPQGPKRLTDVVIGDQMFISFHGMPSKQTNMVWIDEAGDRTVVLRPGFQSKKRLFTIFFAGPLVIDILPEKTTMASRHSTGTVPPNIVAAVQGQQNQTWEPQEHCYSMTMLLPTKQGPQYHTGGRKVTSPAPPTIQP